MFYHELQKQTWITKDNKPYFVTDIDDEEIHLSLYGLYQYYFEPDNFPTDFELLTLPKFNVGDKVLYRQITSKTSERTGVTIIEVDENDQLEKYVARDNDIDIPWIMPIEVEPINY
jgi:hypothetical protein